MSNELEPCPACNRADIDYACQPDMDADEGTTNWVECRTCWTSGPLAKTSELAAEAWNALPRHPVLNPMSEPPKDDRNVLIKDSEGDFYFAEYREGASNWYVNTSEWGPLRYSYVEAIGWIEIPQVKL